MKKDEAYCARIGSSYKGGDKRRCVMKKGHTGEHLFTGDYEDAYDIRNIVQNEHGVGLTIKLDPHDDEVMPERVPLAVLRAAYRAMGAQAAANAALADFEREEKEARSR